MAVGFAMGNVSLPRYPGRLSVRIFHRHEQRVVVQPLRLGQAEALEALAQGTRGRRVESLEYTRPERFAVRDHGREIHCVCGRLRDGPDISGGEKTLVQQAVGTDQERVAGKRGEALIRRVAITGRTKRQHLPQPLLAHGEQIDELEGGGTQVANSIAARKRGRMKQDAARPSKRHGTTGGVPRRIRDPVWPEAVLRSAFWRRLVLRGQTRSPDPASTRQT